MHVKSRFTSLCGGGFVEFEPFCLKSVAGINSEVAPFVAANIEQPAGAPQAMKRDVAIQARPYAVQKGKEKSRPQPRVEGVFLSAEIVVRLVNAFEACRRWQREDLFQAAMKAATRLASASKPETRVEKVAGQFFERPAAKKAASCLLGFWPSQFARRLRESFKTSYRPGCVLQGCTIILSLGIRT